MIVLAWITCVLLALVIGDIIAAIAIEAYRKRKPYKNDFKSIWKEWR